MRFEGHFCSALILLRDICTLQANVSNSTHFSGVMAASNLSHRFEAAQAAAFREAINVSLCLCRCLCLCLSRSLSVSVSLSVSLSVSVSLSHALVLSGAGVCHALYGAAGRIYSTHSR